MSLETAFKAYECHESRSKTLKACLGELYRPKDWAALSAEQTFVISIDDDKAVNSRLMEELETLLLAHTHILGAPDAKLKAMRSLSSGETLRSDSDLLIAYKIGADSAFRQAAANLIPLEKALDVAVLKFFAQGLETYRVGTLVECVRIRRLHYRAKRPGVSGAIRRGKDMPLSDLENLLSLPASDILRHAQSMTLELMQFDRPDLAHGRIANLFDFITACKRLLELAADACRTDANRGAFSTFAMASFPMPVALCQVPRVQVNGRQLEAKFWLDDPFEDQGQRGEMVAEELRESVSAMAKCS